MTERSFVVLPLLELDPDPVLADGTRILDLAVDSDGARPYAPPLVLP
jgi:7,8-dihydro-6-hydroxymethylpterin-pyrophosphokinase